MTGGMGGSGGVAGDLTSLKKYGDAQKTKKVTNGGIEDVKKLLIVFFSLGLCLAGCTSMQKHREGVRDDSTEKISIANVQREIRVGMSGSDVVTALGSPNMVTTDSQRRETWVYDKVATESARSTSSGGLWLILGGVGGDSGAASTSQRTLTIIIKFDNNGNVRDYSYRQSSF